jgi:hypothetical protein
VKPFFRERKEEEKASHHLLNERIGELNLANYFALLALLPSQRTPAQSELTLIAIVRVSFCPS